jgi:hypothetical protein
VKPAALFLDPGGVRLHVRQGLATARGDRLHHDPDRALGVALHDLGRATDELVNRSPKCTDVALERLGDQGISERLEPGVEHGL